MANIQFEDILPWGTTGGDTGLSSRLKLKRNFDKIKLFLDTLIPNLGTHTAWGQTYWEDGKPQDVDGDMTVNGGINIGDTGRGITEDGDASFGVVAAEDVQAEDVTVEDGVTVGDVTNTSLTITPVGLQSGNFQSALIGGAGWRIWLDSQSGLSQLEVDQLTVRLKAYFAELEIRKVSHAGGNLIFSAAASRIEEVVAVDRTGNAVGLDSEGVVGYKCFFKADDGTTATTNGWVVGDQAKCQTFNIDAGKHSGVSNRYYWRKVIAAGDINGSSGDEGEKRSFVVLAAVASGTYHGTAFVKGMQVATGVVNDVPQDGDVIVQLGNQVAANASRQNAIAIEANSDTAPAIYKYQGIDDYSLEGKMVQADYYESEEHTYKSVTYGDWYVGAKPTGGGEPFGHDAATFVRFRQNVDGNPLLEIRAKIDAQSSIGGMEIDEYVNYLTQPLIDGKNSVYTVTQAEMQQSSGPDYKKGDIWILPNAVGVYPAGTILVATSDRGSEHNINKWEKKDSYTDDAAFNGYISRLTNGSIIANPTDAQNITNILNVLKGSLESQTTIEGGLVLTSLIAMHNNSNAVTAGISGNNTNNNIAAWFGGQMIDHEASPATVNFAKSLFRFDGSGYLAGGNISWQADGDTEVKGTVRADNFFHALCFFQYGGIYIYPDSDVLYYYTEQEGFDESYDNFVGGQYYTATEIEELSGGQLGYSSPGFEACTGRADVIMCMPATSGWGENKDMNNTVILPHPADFEGKVVEVSASSYGEEEDFYVGVVGGGLMTGLAYVHDGNVVFSQTSDHTTIKTGGTARFISARDSAGRYAWVLLANDTGGDVIIYGGDSGGFGGIVLNGRRFEFSSGVYSLADLLLTDLAGTLPQTSIDGLTSDLDAKQDAISDLATIRSNATNGQTAYGWGDHRQAGYATEQWAQQNFVLTSALSGYVTVNTDQNITAEKKFMANVWLGAGNALKSVDANVDLLAYKSGTWGGVTGAHWFVGVGGVDGYIRSASALKRWAGENAQYTVWDSSNFTPSEYATQSWVSGQLDNTVTDLLFIDSKVCVKWGTGDQSPCTPQLRQKYCQQQTGISEGWHEVARVVNYGSFLFSVGGGWNNGASTLATFYVTHHHAVNRITQIGTSYLGYITEIRLRDIHEEVGSTGGCIAVDVYVNATTTSIVCAEVIPLDSRPTITMSDFAATDETPSTEVWGKDVENRVSCDYLPLAGGMLDPGAAITLQEIVDNRPVATPVASQRWVGQQGFLTSSDLSAYALRTELDNYQSKLHFHNTNNSGTEASFSHLYLPLTNVSSGYAQLDLSGFVKALGVSGDYVTWTRGDTTDNLTVPFATRAAELRRNYISSGTLDANAMTIDGTKYAIVANYYGASSWVNAPSGMSFGAVAELTAGSGAGVLSGQLAWDVTHNSTTPTRRLWWRARNSTGWGSDWREIAFADGYLPLTAGSGKALTGSLYFSGSVGINWADGEGMLVCKPTSGWTGVSSAQWAVGSLAAQGVIRSGNSDLLHYKGNTAYTIWDSSNGGTGSGLDADLLDGGQMFTVVAPVNGTFNRDSLIRLTETNQGDSIVEKFFVLNHLSRMVASLRDGGQPLLLLNSKHVALTASTIGGVAVKESNVHSKNGTLHVATQPLPYEYNIYEALCDLPEMSAIGNFLRQYDEDWFDADASVSSGIVEGVPVYVDSVVIERNRMLQRIGLINAEDSTYWMVAPTTAGWNKAWAEATQYFVYDEKVLKRDSIQQYWTNRALLDDAIFNMTDQKSAEDSLVSVPYLSARKSTATGKPLYHVFLKPFAQGGILSGAVATPCSNGVLYKVGEWPFDPMKTYFKELWSEGETTSLITAEKECTYNSRRETADSISESAYLQIIPNTATTNWELAFRVNNTLSGNYDVCAVVLPKSVSNQKDPDQRPCKFKAIINYVDEKGVAKSFNCDNKQFQSDPLRVDTVVLAENFHFPACNYDQSDIKVSVRLQCYILARETARYAREMYLDCIYLRPRANASANNNE